ncbi:MAG: tRNA (guanine(46)-N(7))-methyltransferase TrmB [Alphaproteobacteria bacterium]
MSGGEATEQRRLYGRRSARKLRPGRALLLNEALPRHVLPLADAPPDGLRAGDVFGAGFDMLWLEIGFGGGEHLAWQAEANPGIGMIGCEPFMNGVASLLRHIAERGLANVRIHAGDARDAIDRLADASVGRAFILFPDPWPKRRHRERRIVSPQTLDALARVMADAAELRLASDDPTQIRWMLQVAPPHPAFRWLAEGPEDWQARSPDWPETRYEAKARQAGRAPLFLRLQRRVRGREGDRRCDKP